MNLSSENLYSVIEFFNRYQTIGRRCVSGIILIDYHVMDKGSILLGIIIVLSFYDIFLNSETWWKLEDSFTK